MTQPDDGDGKTEPTFTRAQMAKMVAQQVREKVAAALSEYGDLDELKKKAATADANESKLDQVLTKLTEAETRASRAEFANSRREIADEFGLTPKEAKRLSGKTVDELRTDAQEFIEDMGIDVKARKAGKAAPPAEGGDAGNEGEGGNGGDEGQQGDGEDADAGRRTPARAGRPRETLRSGVAGGGNGEPDLEKLDPLELIKGVPRR